MAVTLTKLAGPYPVGSTKEAIYTLAFDNNYPTGGEAIDLSGDFDYVWWIGTGGNDTLADNGHLFQAVLPAPATAASSSNTLISVFWSADGTDGESFIEFTNTGDLSAVGTLRLCVKGT